MRVTCCVLIYTLYCIQQYAPKDVELVAYAFLQTRVAAPTTDMETNASTCTMRRGAFEQQLKVTSHSCIRT